MVAERQFDENPPNSVGEIPVDAVAHLMSQPIRRTLLECLYLSGEPLAVADVAKEIVWRINENSREDVTRKEAKKRYLSLQHRDIPKLAEYGLVRMNDENMTVALTERGEDLMSNSDDVLYQTRE